MVKNWVSASIDMGSRRARNVLVTWDSGMLEYFEYCGGLGESQLSFTSHVGVFDM
jgi:hypothetical protein